MIRLVFAIMLVCISASAQAQAAASDWHRELLATAPGCAQASPEATQCFGLDLFVVVESQAPVRDNAWILDQLAYANDRFAPAGIAFELASVQILDQAWAEIETPDQRNRLGRPHHTHGTIQCFLVRRLANIDAPGDIRGVHWRDRDDWAKRWIIWSSISQSLVLTHELGHFFGLPHTTHRDSLMNKKRRKKPHLRIFPDAEVTTIKKHAKRMVRKKRLVERPRVPKKTPR